MLPRFDVVAPGGTWLGPLGVLEWSFEPLWWGVEMVGSPIVLAVVLVVAARTPRPTSAVVCLVIAVPQLVARTLTDFSPPVEQLDTDGIVLSSVVVSPVGWLAMVGLVALLGLGLRWLSTPRED